MMKKIDEEPNFLFNIVFSDKATFEVNDNVNRHVDIVLMKILTGILQAHTQHPENV